MGDGSSIRRSLMIERWPKARIYTQNYNVKEEYGRDDVGQTASISASWNSCMLISVWGWASETLKTTENFKEIII